MLFPYQNLHFSGLIFKNMKQHFLGKPDLQKSVYDPHYLNIILATKKMFASNLYFQYILIFPLLHLWKHDLLRLLE